MRSGSRIPARCALTGASDSSRQNPANIPVIRIMPGPMTTTISAGKMQRASGRGLDRDLLGLLLSPLTAHEPHLFGLLAQDVGDGQSESVGLDDGADKGPDLRGRGALAHPLERLTAGVADLDLGQDAANSPAIGPSTERATCKRAPSKLLAGLHADGQHASASASPVRSCVLAP